MLKAILDWFLEACEKDVLGGNGGVWWEKGRGQPFLECRVRRARTSRRAENETVRPCARCSFSSRFSLTHTPTLLKKWRKRGVNVGRDKVVILGGISVEGMSYLSAYKETCSSILIQGQISHLTSPMIMILRGTLSFLFQTRYLWCSNIPMHIHLCLQNHTRAYHTLKPFW